MRNKPFFAIILCLLLLSSCQSTSKHKSGPQTGPQSAMEKITSIQSILSSPTVKPGSVLRWSLELSAPWSNGLLRGRTGEREFVFYPVPEKKGNWYEGLIGVDYHHPLGFVKAESLLAEPVEVSFEVVPGSYSSEKLNVSPKKVSLNAKALLRIEREKKLVDSIYERITENRFWKKGIELPINSAVTSAYGTSRVFNGRLDGFHNGVDFRAPMGSRINTAMAGVVVLAEDLFFSGHTVIVDHGYGIFTLYAHLGKINVRVGQTVSQGALLGFSGKTGRVSGPHLHWGAVVQKYKVNPLEVVELLK